MKSRYRTSVFAIAAFLLGTCASGNLSYGQTTNHVVVDASAPIEPPRTGYLHLGGKSSNGHSLEVNSRYLVLDGQPWLPVMGEFHFSRYPESQWEDEILKMKAGGIDIISTYVIWIHHEEVEGQFDWTGQRDLRRFVELCAKHGLYVWLRVGPWDHGEVRNGGFPDWIAKLPKTRTNDPTYIHYVERFYNQIGEQVRGLMFQEGGPVIGTQLENEYSQHGPGRGTEHILKLKQLAVAAGITPPLFSVTVWPSLDFPPQEVIPVSGGYPDGFWFASQKPLPPSITYLFNFQRELGDMGATVASEDPTGKVDLRHYPYSAAEEAGGMASAYHRRPVLSADDIAALTLTGLGSGVNLYGYYMFHGGANPKGKLTTLQESSATGYPNDLPEVTYDFGAPLGEFGQERESYRKLRMLHLFLHAYGSKLATMPSFAPSEHTRDAANTSLPRVAVRSDGTSGFLFVNNYVRQLSMPARHSFQVSVRLPGHSIAVPAQPLDVPAGAYFVWPFNMPLQQATLQYSTAQFLTQLDTPSGRLAVFFAIPGIAPEFSFDPSTVSFIDAPKATVARHADSILVTHVTPGADTTLQITDKKGGRTTVLLLTQEQAEETSLFRIGEQDHLIRSSSSLFIEGKSLHLRSTGSPLQTLEALPALPMSRHDGKQDGLWTRYTFEQPEKHPELSITQIQAATPRASMEMGPYVAWRKTAVPLVPPDAAFAKAATWQIQWKNPDTSGISEALLDIRYAGDIGRLSSSSTLLDDNFFNGLPWQVGLTRFGPKVQSSPLTLQLLPLPPKPPIYLDSQAQDLLHQARQQPDLISVSLILEYESVAPLIF